MTRYPFLANINISSPNNFGRGKSLENEKEIGKINLPPTGFEPVILAFTIILSLDI